MVVTINDEQLNEDLKSFITQDGDKNVLDVSKLKTEADVQRVLQAKQHVDSELTQLKQKYKNVNVDEYDRLMQSQLEQNKDVLSNPVYKNLESRYNTLTEQYNNLNNELEKWNQAIIDGELKDIIRANKEIQPTAGDDIFYRIKVAGFSKTEKGFLSKDGKTVDAFIDDMKSTAKHLFKYTPSSKFNQENLTNGLRNNDKKAVFENLKKLN